MDSYQREWQSYRDARSLRQSYHYSLRRVGLSCYLLKRSA
jgi:hypothetical protein